ncbi:hypothetical protein Tco_1500247 [Tanacetum coccineum]
MGDEIPIRTLGDYSKPSHEGYRNTIELLVGNNVAGGKLRDLNAKESWALLEDLALYDNESWSDLRDFAKPVKAMALPQDVPSTSDRRLIELENQVQRLMEAYLASTQPTQVNKITSSYEICSGPHDAYDCMEGPEHTYVDYASSRTNEMGAKRITPNQGPRNFNDSIDTWKDKPNFNWGRTQTFTNPQNGSISVYSSSYQIKLKKALLDFESNQEKKLSHLRTQLGQQQDDMIGKIYLLWKTVSEKLNDVSTSKNAENSMAHKSITAISHDEREELRKNGIKIPSKLFSPKYLSSASIKELNKNPSAPKRLHFGVYSYYNTGVDISNWEMFDDDWGLESKEVSPLGELSLFDRPNEVERCRILKACRLESILNTLISTYGPLITDECGDGVTIYTRRRHRDTCDGVRIFLTESIAQLQENSKIVIFDEKKLGSS